MRSTPCRKPSHDIRLPVPGRTHGQQRHRVGTTCRGRTAPLTPQHCKSFVERHCASQLRGSSAKVPAVQKEGELPQTLLRHEKQVHQHGHATTKSPLARDANLNATQRALCTRRLNNNPKGHHHSPRLQQTRPPSPVVEQRLQRETQLARSETLLVRRDCRVPVPAQGSQTTRCPRPQH